MKLEMNVSENTPMYLGMIKFALVSIGFIGFLMIGHEVPASQLYHGSYKIPLIGIVMLGFSIMIFPKISKIKASLTEKSRC